RSRAGVLVPVTQLAGESMAYDRLVVCAGNAAAQKADEELLGWLRRLRRHGTALAGLDGGTWLLARAGVVTGRPLVVHWTSRQAFQESFPELQTVRERRLLAGDTASAAGGLAAFELILAWIAEDQGQALADQ